MTHEENEARPRTRLDETVRASLGATAVLMLATVVFSMVMTGAYLNYLQAWLGPYLLAASIACGVLALWTLLETAENVGRRGAADGHGVPKVGALLLVPALLFAMAVPSSLGADALREAQPQQRVAADEALVFPPLDGEEVNELSLQDYSDRYVFGHPEELVGKPVRLLGFVGRLTTLPEGQWTVNRFRIFCCVADSTLFAAVVTGAPMPEGREVWVEVEGVIDLAASDRLPVIVATDVEVVAKPEEPYL